MKKKKWTCKKCGKILWFKGVKIISLEKMLEMRLCKKCFMDLTEDEVGKEVVIII